MTKDEQQLYEDLFDMFQTPGYKKMMEIFNRTRDNLKENAYGWKPEEYEFHKGFFAALNNVCQYQTFIEAEFEMKVKEDEEEAANDSV